MYGIFNAYTYNSYIQVETHMILDRYNTGKKVYTVKQFKHKLMIFMSFSENKFIIISPSIILGIWDRYRDE